MSFPDAKDKLNEIFQVLFIATATCIDPLNHHILLDDVSPKAEPRQAFIKFASVPRTFAPLPSFGASHLYSAARLVWSPPPVFTTRVSVTCVACACS